MAKQLHEQALGNANVQNFLRMLATAEGTLKNGADPYRVGFGGSQIADLSAHPNIVKPFRQTDGKMNKTSAAGAYQFLNKTWTPLQQQLGLKDFSPRSQDIAAIELIRQAFLSGLCDRELCQQLWHQWRSFLSGLCDRELAALICIKY